MPVRSTLVTINSRIVRLLLVFRVHTEEEKARTVRHRRGGAVWLGDTAYLPYLAPPRICTVMDTTHRRGRSTPGRRTQKCVVYPSISCCRPLWQIGIICDIWVLKSISLFNPYVVSVWADRGEAREVQPPEHFVSRLLHAQHTWQGRGMEHRARQLLFWMTGSLLLINL